MVYGAESGNGICHRQTHLMADSSVGRMQFGHLGAGVEPLHRLHEIEDRVTENRDVLAHRDERGMRDVGVGQGAQHPRLAQDHRVADRPQMPRAPAQHIVPPGLGEPQHDVLGTAEDRRDVSDRTVAKTLSRHPRRHP